LTSKREDEARGHVEAAKKLLKDKGIEVNETIVKIGNPVDKIVEAGANYSVIVVSATAKPACSAFSWAPSPSR